MYSLKGFMHVGAFVDNTAAVVAKVGELHPIGWTYAKEKTEHVSSSNPTLTLITFTSNRDNVRVQPNEVTCQDILTIMAWVYSEALAGSFSRDSEEFERLFINRWGSTAELNSTGTMTQDRGNIWVPEFIDISLRDEEEENRLKVWWTSDAFRNQYDDYEIEVLLPLDPPDKFFGEYAAVKALIDAVSLTKVLEQAATGANEYPYTYLVNNEFFWTDPTLATRRIKTNFPVLIWGIAGNNIDTIKEKIIEKILANTTHSREDWAAIFPDLFTATEVIIVPMQMNYAIPNKVLVQGLYSSVTDIVQAVEVAQAVVKGEGYSDEYVQTAIQIVANTYKAMNLLAVCGPNNRDGLSKFNKIFPDYIAVSSTHGDFLRMSAYTRQFILQLNAMLLYAEEMTPDSSVPLQHTRLVRDGVVYLARSYDNIQILIVTKYSLNDPAILANILVDGNGNPLTDGTQALVNN